MIINPVAGKRSLTWWDCRYNIFRKLYTIYY
nr:MAG TPA: hypothetical protein [Caudoviricetes sp.]